MDELVEEFTAVRHELAEMVPTQVVDEVMGQRYRSLMEWNATTEGFEDPPHFDER